MAMRPSYVMYSPPHMAEIVEGSRAGSAEIIALRRSCQDGVPPLREAIAGRAIRGADVALARPLSPEDVGASVAFQLGVHRYFSYNERGEKV